MSSVALIVIARDEEDTILRCLRSAEPIVTRYLIIDTGSVDATRGLVAEWLRTHDGTLYRRDWKGFAHNRTEALALARGQADYLLMLDADHVLHIDAPLPELSADSYMLRIRGALEWRLPLLVKGDRAWRYQGVAHSYLVGAGPTVSANLDSLSVDGGGGVTAEKLERDVQVLSAEVAKNPLSPRDVFYLARSYDDLDRPLEAIHYYRMRANMNGWAEERFYARFRLGYLLVEHINYFEGARELLAAAEMLPARAAEPLRALANAGHHVADKVPQPPDGLFVRTWDYRKEPA